MKCDAKKASVLAMRMSQASERAMPPPTAAPCTAAITGGRASWIASIRSERYYWYSWM